MRSQNANMIRENRRLGASDWPIKLLNNDLLYVFQIILSLLAYPDLSLCQQRT